MSTLLNYFRQQVKTWVKSRLQGSSDDQPAPIAVVSTATSEPTHTAETLADSVPATGPASLSQADNNPEAPRQKTVAAMIEVEKNSEANLLQTPFAKARHLFVKTSSLHGKVTPFIEQKLGKNFLVSELMALEPSDFSTVKGVGPAKVTVLRQIQREVKLLSAP